MTAIWDGIKIISYQEIKGNYSDNRVYDLSSFIISYQEIKGNYSYEVYMLQVYSIISYQEIKGNYSRLVIS